MRRILGQVILYPVRLAGTLAEQWNAFWYTPADPTLMGLLRILTGLMLLYTHAVWGLALDDFFGPSSWLNLGLVREIQRDQFAYSFWPWIPAQWAWLAHSVSMGILVLFTIGLWSRLSSILALVVAISYIQRVPAALFGLDQINVMLTLYLTIGGSGQSMSVDRWMAWLHEGDETSPPPPSVAANFGLRLIQVHMCVIYFFAGISKLQGPAWWNGEAMWLAFANQEYQSADMTWLAWHPWLLNMISYTTVLWEMSFCTLIWRPLTRPLVLLAAVLLHVGIGVCLGMWTFGLIMLVGCASFLPVEEVRLSVARLFSKRGRTRTAEMRIGATAMETALQSGGPALARSGPPGRGRTVRAGTAVLGPPNERSICRSVERQTACLANDLVPVFVVVTQTTIDPHPDERLFVHPESGDPFQPLYIVVSFDESHTPLATS